jgi:hypothetical protein
VNTNLCYARAGSLYSHFLQRHRILSTKLLNQGFLKNCQILYLSQRFSKDINVKTNNDLQNTTQKTMNTEYPEPHKHRG